MNADGDVKSPAVPLDGARGLISFCARLSLGWSWLRESSSSGRAVLCHLARQTETLGNAFIVGGILE